MTRATLNATNLRYRWARSFRINLFFGEWERAGKPCPPHQRRDITATTRQFWRGRQVRGW